MARIHRQGPERDAAPDSVAADVVSAAAADTLMDAARVHVAAGRPVQASHFTHLPGRPADARRCAGGAADTHEVLLADTENFWRRPGSPSSSTN